MAGGCGESLRRGALRRGTPARVICSLADYAAKHRAKMTGENTFGEEYRMGQSLDQDKKREMIAATDGKIAFIR